MGSNPTCAFFQQVLCANCARVRQWEQVPLQISTCTLIEKHDPKTNITCSKGAGWMPEASEYFSNHGTAAPASTKELNAFMDSGITFGYDIKQVPHHTTAADRLCHHEK